MDTKIDIPRISEEAVVWIRRQLERAKLTGTLAPRIVNPRTQGWIHGFAVGLGDVFALAPDKRYELEARIFVGAFEGTPMGERLGLEALQMAQRMESLPGAAPALDDWRANVAKGRAAAESFAALERALDDLYATLAP